MSKTSRLNLYSSDNLEEKGAFVEATDAKLVISSPNVFELSAPQFALQGQTTASHNISNLGLYLKTLSDTQSGDSAAQSALIASNTTNLSAEIVNRQADTASLTTLIGTETANRSSADTVLQANIDAEAGARASADTTLQANIDAEVSARAIVVANEETARVNADSALQSQIDALGVVDATTLANINNMLVAYQAADNSISALITAMDARVTALEAQVATLTA